MSLVTDLLYALLILISLPVIIYRRLRSTRRTHWGARLGVGRPLQADPRQTVLLHGVSVGEIQALRSVVDSLLALGHLRVVVSSTTDTGMAEADRLFGERCAVVRYPLDFTFCVRRFLSRVNPALVALVELEVWPNFIRECRRRRIVTAVINGRISAGNHRVSRWAGPILRGAFGSLDLVLAQSESYAERFRSLGTPGDRIEKEEALKWDVDASGDRAPTDIVLAQALGIDRERPVILAISTGPGEEEMLSRARVPPAQLILAPRHPERFEEVAAALPQARRRSESPDGSFGEPSGADLFLLDSVGEIDRALTLADVAVVGRSFREEGGSNPIQSAAAGVPTLIGPGHDNFVDIVDTLREAQGVRVTSDPMRTAAELLSSEHEARELARRGLAVIRDRQGSGKRTAKRLLNLLADAELP